jgi:long-chain fatty acid transport protein
LLKAGYPASFCRVGLLVRPDEQMIADRPIPAFVLAVLAAGISCLSARANGLRLVSQDAFAAARGEAFVATADNASAIYYNPAGITQLEGLNFRAGVYGIYLDPTYTPPAPANTSKFHIIHQWAAAPQSFTTWTPEEWAASFGLGVYVPYGGNIGWPQDTGFRTVATGGSLNYVTINPVIALKLAPELSIAAGVMVSYADLELEQGLRPYASPAINFFRFDGDGWSAGYNLGLLWQPHEKVSVGATYRSQTKFTLQGNTEFEQQQLVQYTERSAQAGFTFPWTGVLGISYRPTPKWNIEFDADYTDWSSFGQTAIYQTPAPPRPIQQNVPVTLDWQGSWMYEFGVTRYFGKGWHVSVGYLFNENSVPDSYYSPVAADLDRHFFSVGTGYKGKRVSFDVAYQFGYGPARTVTGSTPSSTPGLFSGQSADGTYDFISHAVLLTVGLHF